MKRILNRDVPLWILLAVLVVVAAIPIVLSAIYASESDFLHVPFASWFVLGLSGLLLAMGGIALYFWRRLRAGQEKLARVEEELTAVRDELAEPLEHLPVVCGHTKLSKAEFVVVVQSLFRPFLDIGYVYVTPMPGGYGGSTTVSARLQEKHSQDLLPQSFVVKLGDKKEMVDERDKFDNYVYARLVNTPHFSIHRYAEWGPYAGISYEFAGLGGELQNFYQFYDGSPALAVAECITQVYSHLSQAWYRHGQVTPANLYHEYNLLNKKREIIIRHMGKIIGKDDDYHDNLRAASEALDCDLKPDFCDGLDIPWRDPVTFLRTWSIRPLQVPVHRSVVHGDLHARNVLVEIIKGGSRQIWFIDFSHTGNGLSRARTEEASQESTLVDPDRGHTLRDFCRLEADIKFTLTRLRGEGDLDLAVAFEKELMARGMALDDLQDKPPRIEALADGRFRKAWQAIREIRSQAAGYLVDSGDLRPYYFGLLHASLPLVYYGSEQFENEVCEQQQKRYAFISAGMLCSQLQSGGMGDWREGR